MDAKLTTHASRKVGQKCYIAGEHWHPLCLTSALLQSLTVEDGGPSNEATSADDTKDWVQWKPYSLAICWHLQQASSRRFPADKVQLMAMQKELMCLLERTYCFWLERLNNWLYRLLASHWIVVSLNQNQNTYGVQVLSRLYVTHRKTSMLDIIFYVHSIIAYTCTFHITMHKTACCIVYML